jgi:hypothetical protein
VRIGPVLGRLGLVLLGGYVGVVGAVVHRHRVEALGVVWPWGLLLALVATGAVAVATGRFVRLGESWYALGWAAMLLVQLASPGGSYLVAADGLGWTYTILGLGVLGFVAVRNSRLAR